MSIWCRIYYKFLNILLQLLIKNKVISVNQYTESKMNSYPFLFYVLPYNSQIDLLILRIECLKQGLPDPLKPLKINNIILPHYVFLNNESRLISWYTNKSRSVSIFYKYFDLHINDTLIDVLLVPVSVLFNLSPKKISKFTPLKPRLRTLNSIKKICALLLFRYNSVVHFSRTLSFRYIVTKHGTDRSTAKKLARVLRIHFSRQQLKIVQLQLPVRQDIFKKLLKSKAIKQAIEDEVRSKKISVKKAQQNITKLIEEIAANFSYNTICIFDKLLGWICKRLYQKLYVHNAVRVRELAKQGHEIIYVPCHRSHMDYLILSYVLYHEGMVPPHIVAGINLNFWPVGLIFRRLGAFFIRRTFKGNKLYSIIFREYLNELFTYGYSVEYFIEGRRSRTGRLLEPKTGILTMTIQAILRGSNRPITLVPIYIGYEHVIEVETYIKELSGAIKKKEGLWQVIRGLSKLRNLGYGYINFGVPLSLDNWLSQQVPLWRNSINQLEPQRPSWLAFIVDKIAITLMISMNNSTAVNAINLCFSALLASPQYSLTREQLLTQVTCYLELLRNVPYTDDITVPNLTSEMLLNHALEMKKFTIKHDSIEDIIYLSHNQAILANYYSNNIQHLFILPSLIANIICNYQKIERMQLHRYIILFYPLLKAELFMCYSYEELPYVIDNFITELERQKLVIIQNTCLSPIQSRLCILHLLAANISKTLQRYAIIFAIFRTTPQFQRETFIKKSLIIAQRLSILHGIYSLDFFDHTILLMLINALRSEEYLNDTGLIIYDKANKIYNVLNVLLMPDILNTIKNSS